MSYFHLTIKERMKVEAYLELGLKPSQIASKLGIHRSTISRELRWCQVSYDAGLAQEHYEKVAKQKGRNSSLTPELKEEIEKSLKASWSPEQICGRYQLELRVLRSKVKSRQVRERRGKFMIGTPIAKRPKEVKS